MRLLKYVTFLFSALIPCGVFAGLHSDLDRFFEGLGSYSNRTGAEVYRSQQAGLYTGGSFYLRNPVQHVQFAHLTLPKMRAGCGGIDLFEGGFSFIQRQELQAMMKKIMASGASYAFLLAIKSVSPQIASTLEYIQKKADEVNRFNMNSCEMGQALVGGMWPNVRAAQRQICRDVGASHGLFADWAAARQGCGANGEMANQLNQAKQYPEQRDRIVENTNIVWRAMQKSHFLADDPQLAELFMSLSGTIVVYHPSNNDDDSPQLADFPSLATNRTLITAFLQGGSAQMYVCADNHTDCLDVQVRAQTIPPEQGLIPRIRRLLHSMTDKILQDAPLTNQEKGLLNTTRLPVYKLLDVQAAFNHGRGAIDVDDYATIIAIDIVYAYFQEALSSLRAQLREVDYDQSMMHKLARRIDNARMLLHQTQLNGYQQLSMSLQLIKETQYLEQLIAGEMSSQLSSNLKGVRSAD